MVWFRSRSKFAAYAALVALALQFLAAFGHGHVTTTASAFSSRYLAVTCDIACSDRTSEPGDVCADQSRPDRGDNAVGDICAVCATLAIAASALSPEAPVLALPDAPAASSQQSAFADGRIDSGARAFHARAPPAA